VNGVGQLIQRTGQAALRHIGGLQHRFQAGGLPP
jgi:hypothetical protein